MAAAHEKEDDIGSYSVSDTEEEEEEPYLLALDPKLPPALDILLVQKGGVAKDASFCLKDAPAGSKLRIHAKEVIFFDVLTNKGYATVEDWYETLGHRLLGLPAGSELPPLESQLVYGDGRVFLDYDVISMTTMQVQAEQDAMLAAKRAARRGWQFDEDDE